jgi:hypothetical protein
MNTKTEPRLTVLEHLKHTSPVVAHVCDIVEPGAVKLLIGRGNYDPMIGMVATELEDLYAILAQARHIETGAFSPLQKGQPKLRSHSVQCQRVCWAFLLSGQSVWAVCRRVLPSWYRVTDRLRGSPFCAAWS